MHVTPAMIRHAFDSGTFTRGQTYARDGMVRSVQVVANRIHGEVWGSGHNFYEQVILLAARPGGGIDVVGDCTCPVQHNCKHVVAVLLAGGGQDVTLPPAAPAARLSGPAQHWLHQLAMLNDTADRAAAAARPGHRIAFVLCPNARTREVSLHLCKAAMRTDGGIASATVLTDTKGLVSKPPAYVRAEDEIPIGLYAALRAVAPFEVETRPAGRIAAQLLDMLAAQERLWWAPTRADLTSGRAQAIHRGQPRHAAIGWRPICEKGGAVGIRWLFDDGEPVDHVLPTEPVGYLHEGAWGELVLPPNMRAVPIERLMMLLAQAPVLSPAERDAMTRQMVEHGLDRILPPPAARQLQERRDITPTPHLTLGCEDRFKVTGRHQWRDYALLFFTYDGIHAGAEPGPPLRRITADSIEVIHRDEHAEQKAAALLSAMGFAPLPGPDAVLGLPTEEHWLAFAQNGIAILRKAGWRVEMGDTFRYDLRTVDDWYADVADEGDKGNAWFELELGIIVEGRRQPLLPLLVQLIRKAPERFDPAALADHEDASRLLVQLPDGAFVALPWGRVKPILTILGELFFDDRVGDSVRLPVIDAARLAELEQHAQLRWLGGQRLRALGRRLGQFGGVQQVAPPAGLQATLRDYQGEGLAWMQFLREYEFGGILADDMGLGKTVQTLAHILIEKEAGRLDAPALVVVPTSLIANWRAEAARFTPGLRVLTLHGKDRQVHYDSIGQADLVLTTYALLPRDEMALRALRFHLLILDESQYIKNSRAKVAQTARLLNARHRLCLTGTPLQNHLGELWSQFHFLMPGLLGEEKAFNANFRKPIEVQHDMARNAFLTRRVKPFMLRRTKDKVASELPPKTEIVLTVELGGAQRDLYETVRVAMDKKVRDEIERKGVARSQIVILEALLKMRQACCDPRLVKTAGLAKSGVGSAKLTALMELVDTLMSEERKVLVFSQFTSMLELIAAELRHRAIDFVTLTGETQDRATPVAQFQQGAVPVFLISLKAGGVGLNLTAADAVIHYDPWWNPAAENQATDRAWRIGQDKPVFVYKLIAEGTLEEKIQDMQRRKGNLADAIMGEGGKLDARLTPDDLQAIFAPL